MLFVVSIFHLTSFVFLSFVFELIYLNWEGDGGVELILESIFGRRPLKSIYFRSDRLNKNNKFAVETKLLPSLTELPVQQSVRGTWVG